LLDVRQSLALLSVRERWMLYATVSIQSLLALMDVVGVLALGAAAAIGASALNPDGAGPGGLTRPLFGISTFFSQASDPLTLAVMLSVLAAGLLLIKSIASSLITRHMLMFLAKCQASVSNLMTRLLLNTPLVRVQTLSSQEVTYALGPGATMATVVVLGQTALAVSEICVLSLLALLLFLVNPLVAAAALTYFVVLGVVIQRFLGRWSSGIGGDIAKSEVTLAQTTQEVLQAFREITVSGRKPHYLHRFTLLRADAAQLNGRVQYLGQIPKYTLEAALVIGIALLAAYALVAPDSVQLQQHWSCSSLPEPA